LHQAPEYKHKNQSFGEQSEGRFCGCDYRGGGNVTPLILQTGYKTRIEKSLLPWELIPDTGDM
jgi:hypothetical protein